MESLEELQNTDFKEIRHQLKKMNGHRLDFAYQFRRRGKIPAEEIRRVGDKFLSSKELAERNMFYLLQRDISHLATLVSALFDFHHNAEPKLVELHETCKPGELVLDQPCCRALYTFIPNHEGELSFSEGDITVLTERVDGNWYEGRLCDSSGLLPVSYVKVLVPLPFA